MNNIIGIIIMSIYIGAVLIVSKFISKLGEEAGRKFVHIMLANVWLFMIYFFDSVIWASILPAAFVVINSLSYKFNIMKSIEREENDSALLPESQQYITSAKYTVDIMAEAPTIVFVVNTLGKSILSELTPEERIFEICNIQSIGASIQNMLLAATEKGIGSLWICDIYFAYLELCKWLNSDGELVAAIAFGYPNEFPKERPRRKIDDVIEWRK